MGLCPKQACIVVQICQTEGGRNVDVRALQLLSEGGVGFAFFRCRKARETENERV